MLHLGIHSDTPPPHIHTHTHTHTHTLKNTPLSSSPSCPLNLQTVEAPPSPFRQFLVKTEQNIFLFINFFCR